MVELYQIVFDMWIDNDVFDKICSCYLLPDRPCPAWRGKVGQQPLPARHRWGLIWEIV